MKSFVHALTLMAACVMTHAVSAADATYDLVVFGGTPGGLTAAVAAARAGEKVVVLEPSNLVGGMMAGGLTKSDITKRENCGGLALETFKRIEAYYVSEYGADSPQARDSHGGIYFEPHVAGLVFARVLSEAGVDVRRQQPLTGVTVEKNAITSIRVRDGATGGEVTVRGRIFIDATYEGDLLAMAGVPYRVGREARDEWGEKLAGFTAGPELYRGKGDHRVQSYNFRSTLTTRDDIRVPVPKPARYDREDYRGLVESVNKHGFKSIEELYPDSRNWGMVNGKADPNKADAVGFNFAYAEGDSEQRARIADRMRDYWLGLWWTLQNDPALPENFKVAARHWGLPKDEFVETGNVSPQVYVRVARRMLGAYHLTQNDVELYRRKPDAVCLGSYNLDSHEVQRFLTPEGSVGEGGFIEGVDPYEIPYRALTPIAPGNLIVVCAVSATHVAYSTLRMEPCFMMLGHAAGYAAHLAHKGNTTVQEIPIKELQQQLEASGIALHAPYRPAVQMELPPNNGVIPVGQPVTFHAKLIDVTTPIKTYFWNFDGTGEVQSTDRDPTYTFTTSKPTLVSLITVDTEGRKSLVDERLIQVGEEKVGDISQVFTDAQSVGVWARAVSHSEERRFRNLYQDRNEGKGQKRVTFSATPKRSGRYAVSIAFRAAPGRASNVPVTIEHADGTASIEVDQRKPLTPFALAPLGVYRFEAGRTYHTTVSNAHTDGLMTIDEIRWVWLGEK
ncbi:MAG TPA: FAD-dependent oxidoreductase [Opitutaceae bacterium]|nr:FAD-dependent oxidoreductase [Opitutaceae bacterium]